jgi:hypothetical protein
MANAVLLYNGRTLTLFNVFHDRTFGSFLPYVEVLTSVIGRVTALYYVTPAGHLPIWYHNDRAVLCLRSGRAALRTTLSKCRPRLLRVLVTQLTIKDLLPIAGSFRTIEVMVARAMSGPRHESSIGQFRSHARARTSLPKAE